MTKSCDKVQKESIEKDKALKIQGFIYLEKSNFNHSLKLKTLRYFLFV
jgi:hypothetical protein